jgi:hypothetical protein
MRQLAFTLLSLSVLSSLAGAQITTDSIVLGGPGSQASSGFDDPGLLDDGLTEASAVYVFTLDVGAATLEVEVTNTSPVVVGVQNPLLTDVYFNVPAAITGMTLSSQSAIAGVPPAYAFTFDADRTDGSGTLQADGFGAFSVELADTGNIQGTIANPDADTYTVPAAQLAISPVTFTFSLTGTLAGLTATDFLEELSHIPPGSRPSFAVAKFQAGGVAGASGYINEGDPCPSAGATAALGASCGGVLAASPTYPGGYSTVTYDGSTPLAVAMLRFSEPAGLSFVFGGCQIHLRRPSSLAGMFVTDLNGDFQTSLLVRNTHLCGDEIILQALIYNPSRPPLFAEISNGVRVTLGN